MDFFAMSIGFLFGFVVGGVFSLWQVTILLKDYRLTKEH
jgi:hypothetical protein